MTSAIRVWILHLIILLPIVASAQDEVTDSLKRALGGDLEPEVRIQILIDLSSRIISNNPGEALMYSRGAMERAEQENLLDQKGWAMKNMGLATYNMGDYVNAMDIWEQALDIFERTENLDGVSNILNNLGAKYNEQGDDAKALEYLLQSLRVAEEIDDPVRIGTALLNIGSVYMKKANTRQQGIDNLEKALPYFEEADYALGSGVAAVNVGETFLLMNEPDSSLIYLKKAQDIFESVNAGFLSYTLNLIGKAYNQKGEHRSAIEIQVRAVELAREREARLEEAHALLGLADSYLGAGNLKIARSDYLLAESIYTDLGVKEGLKDVYEGLSKTYTESNDFENALKYQRLYGNYKDSIYNIATADQLRNLRFTYDLEKKEGEIELLNKENEIQEAQIQKARVARNFLFATAAFILIILGGVVVQYRLTKRAREKEAALNQERELNEQLQQIDKLKDQFLANTSHELRTPLNGIIGLAESLRDGAAGPLPEKAMYNLDMIQSSGRRLANLVNDILDFSKLRSHDIELRIRPLDIYAVVDLVLQLSKPLLGNKKVKLVNNIARRAPLVDADENRIQQILHNLVDNAIKFTHEGQIIVSSEARDNGKLAISIEDQGIGIPDDKFDVIFQSFEQGDGTTAREYGGTGLGLSVTRQLVELHGGKVEVKSEVGKGSKFTFTLPLSKESRERREENIDDPEKEEMIHGVSHDEPLGTEEVKIDPVASRSPILNGDHIEVLVVDDEPVNRQVLENHLSLAGYGVTQAESGQEALEIIRTSGKQFDMVLLDIMMPRMSGYEVCNELRNRYLPSELPVVMLTAKNQLDDLVQGFTAGANDYLTKPFMKDELLSRIKTHLNLHRINQATGKFVPMQFLKVLGRETITEVRLGDNHQKEVTVFFSDIRAYTNLSENMTPDENFRFVNAYNRRMGPIIETNEGFVNQYLGDGIMAIFPDQAQQALKAAVEMQQKIQEYNLKRLHDGRLPIRVGMGLHTGSLIMGITGDGRRMDATTVSDAVNTASRIEGLTKYFQNQILLSEVTLSKLSNPEAFNLRYLGQVQVKGKEQPLGIYECFDGDESELRDLKIATLEVFNDGLKLYLSKDFQKAIHAFSYVLKENPEDGTAKMMLKKAKNCFDAGVDHSWTGVETMTSK